MKKTLLLWSMLICIFTIGNAQDISIPDPNFKAALLANPSINNAQDISIPDPNFKAALLANPSINTDGNEEISSAEALSVTNLDVSDRNISNIDGIEHFVNLDVFIANNNNISEITEAHTATLTKLRILNAVSNNISYIDVRACSLWGLVLTENPVEYAYLIGDNTFQLDTSFGLDLGLYTKDGESRIDEFKYVCISSKQYFFPNTDVVYNDLTRTDLIPIPSDGHRGRIWQPLKDHNVLHIDTCSIVPVTEDEPKTFDDYYTLIPPGYNSNTVLLAPVKTNVKIKEIEVYSAEIHGIPSPSYSGRSLRISNTKGLVSIEVLRGHKPGIYVLNIETSVGNFTKKYTKTNLTK